MKKIALLGAVAALAMSSAALAESHEERDFAAEVEALGGDPAAGQQVYRQCMACHVVNQEQNRVGPHQVGIIGRPVAIVESFRYSPAMTAFGEEGNVWDAETLSAYLENPRAYIQGTRMAYAGLRDAQQRADVIAYLLQEGGVYEAPAE